MNFSENQFHYTISILSFILTQIFLFIFAGRTEGSNSDKSFFYQTSSLSFHIHHWIIGLILLSILLLVEYYVLAGQKTYFISFLKGAFLGMVFHGLTYYSDYFDIINRK